MRLLTHTKNLFTICLALAVLGSCETEEIQPIDIFEEENLEELIQNGETTDLPLENICGENRLFVNNDRLYPNLLGYQIKGTIFADSEIGPNRNNAQSPKQCYRSRSP